MVQKQPFKSGTSILSWEELYQSTEVATMPWYNPELDKDLAQALLKRNISSGSFLDIGTGPGTQAKELSKRGFKTTAIDLSLSAITSARLLCKEVDFIVDDFLDTKLQCCFDFAFDRGCMHSLIDEDHPRYLQSACKVIKPGGILFFKQFSNKERLRKVRYISEKDIKKIFSKFFKIEEIKESTFSGPAMADTPKAIFAVMRRKT